MNKSPLPPALQQAQQRAQQWVNQHLPGAQQRAQQVGAALAPVVQEITAQFLHTVQNITRQMAVGGPGVTIGARFKHLCFIGLNKVEYLPVGEPNSVFGETWVDLLDETTKRQAGLFFFAPRGLNGQPVNPYLFLSGDEAAEQEPGLDPAKDAAAQAAQQSIGPVALLDLCRISPASPNTVNILLVADTLFHWDVKDNYILPTNQTSWPRDLEQVLKSYPRTTRAHIYTNWETDLLPPSERIQIHPLTSLPLDAQTWLNQPTFQEKFGPHVLGIGIACAVLAWAHSWYFQSQLNDILENQQIIEQNIPRQGQFSDLDRAITEQEKMWQTRPLMALAVRDTARAIQQANMQVNSFEVRVTEPNDPPKQILVTIEAVPTAYSGWLQQEPVARAVLLNSALLNAVRKPPSNTGFKLEGIITLAPLAKQYWQIGSKKPNTPSSTQVQP